MRQSAVEVYDHAFMQGLKPDPLLTVSEWADANRMLSSVASGEPGPWRTSRTPYLKEIMDCLSPSSSVERVVFMKGAQLGGTEAGLNWIGYVIQQAPGPMLLVQPTVETAKRNSKQRIDPLIEGSTVLQQIVKDPRSRDSGNTVLSKEFPGGILMMTGANSAVGLRSMPIRFLFMDEIDGYPGDADGEGDPVALAVQRTVTFANRKILMVSTPTIKGYSRIEAAYAESDQRKFYVPCPHCGEFQVLVWAQVKWHKGERQAAFYECEFCHAPIQDYQKSQMFREGVWLAEGDGDGRTAGFHLSSLYSPHGWTSWGDVAVEHGQVYKDPPRLKTWTNTKLGETWEEDADRVDGEGLMARREAWGELLPADVAVLTAGVDVQDDRLEIEIVGWGREEESWSIDYRVLWGDPSSPAVWEDLDNLLRHPRPHSRQLPDMTIRAVAIDTGGHHTLKSYAFCRSRQGRRIWAIKGRGGMGVPIWPRKPSTKNKGKVPLFIVGVDACKEAILSRLRIEEPGPGYLHFPMQRDGDYFKQLTAESVVTRYHKGRPIREWKKRDSDRNEALDCRVYAMAALQGLIAMGFRLNRDVEKLAEHPLKNAMPESGASQPKRIKPKRRVIQSSWM
ncbi:phage terminase GpA [Magnetococcus marinus MC-1]|uniref:Phage terminase GpA n=1 Tax=Magnetococcus marinus (strain ATCC BAA-1437 / JCM 17883 / MC-1) TaxID=156889 RepID=A0L725_MAGMM|nr:phage terminase large subunit family protein [Magnetococcus marinus]ABK43768.1 phage terminase GpA [Magnetococcus marinus MC-1]